MHAKAITPLFLLAAGAVLAAPAARQETSDEYDYIVVGSGPGGGPLAVNLAKAGHSVLLLEAGDTSAGGSSQYPPEITWDFFVKHFEDDEKNKANDYGVWKTVEGRYWVGKDNPPEGAEFLGIYYPRGATVGGSSMINAMATWLPTDSDWNYVVEVTGDESWKAENMREIFTRIEKNNYLPEGTPGHGFDGWFQTMMTSGFGPPGSGGDGPANPVTESMASELGLDPADVPELVSSDPNALDPDRDTTQGIYGLPRHQRANGQRYSSRHYILESIEEGIPLTLSVNSLATKVLFETSESEEAKPKAIGVEYLEGKAIYGADPRRGPDSEGTKKTATARREVIISGGTFNTPQILMLSGIGDPEQLEQFDIPVLVEATGVGTSLMDNQEMPVVGQASGTVGFGDPGFIMIQTDHATYDERDMFLMHNSGGVFRGFWPSNQTNELPSEVPRVYSTSMVKQHPLNRAGYVRLQSADPLDTPDINFNLYVEGSETDLGGMRDSIAWVRRVYANVAAPAGPIEPLEPPCPSGITEDGHCTDESEDDEWIIAHTFGHHPTSTVRIGADDDPTAVLDSKFRVRGVEGLRVVDASVFPRIPGVFPVVATFIISQKATDTILEELAAEME
ncbi:Choline dehydrogenase [Scedosporium apiospermum]|uniref:Choline dehydrogenase n=1 Tax=Pseudallescheria apiosperma TaxID=563466 RepID=A0A084GGH4_PSEDA|nr:Choline dehydrogenase [Scedosporium apiospermum]KEZ46436.1 Choline dehydrogenase [Scedosporium apiospermum]